MRFLRALWAALLLPCVTSQIYKALPCDSLEVVDLAHQAVNHINDVQKRGYKVSLDRIENVQQETKDGGEIIYYLEIEVRETICHVLNPKPLIECAIRSFLNTKVEGDCKVIVTKAGGLSSVTGYRCESSPDSAEDLTEKCPNCPTLIPVNSTEVLHAVNVSLYKFNHESNSMHVFQLQDITRASGMQAKGSPIMVEFTIQETPCRKDSLVCPLIFLLSPQTGFCSATVNPTTYPELVDVTCEIYSTKVPVSEVTLSPAVTEGDRGTMASPEAVTESAPAAAPTPSTETAQTKQDISLPPKRKRAVVDQSSESSEEVLIGSGVIGGGGVGGSVPVWFPDLPADLTTCPGLRRHHEHQ